MHQLLRKPNSSLYIIKVRATKTNRDDTTRWELSPAVLMCHVTAGNNYCKSNTKQRKNKYSKDVLQKTKCLLHLNNVIYNNTINFAPELTSYRLT